MTKFAKITPIKNELDKFTEDKYNEEKKATKIVIAISGFALVLSILLFYLLTSFSPYLTLNAFVIIIIMTMILPLALTWFLFSTGSLIFLQINRFYKPEKLNEKYTKEKKMLIKYENSEVLKDFHSLLYKIHNTSSEEEIEQKEFDAGKEIAESGYLKYLLKENSASRFNKRNQ